MNRAVGVAGVGVVGVPRVAGVVEALAATEVGVARVVGAVRPKCRQE